MNLLQLTAVYILHNAIVYNKVSKMEFITDLFVIEFNDKHIAYDLNNNNLKIGSNMGVKVDTKKTKYETILQGGRNERQTI